MKNRLPAQKKRGAPGRKGGCTMKGYLTGNGYMGYVDGRYILFSSEDEYEEYMNGEE